MCNFSAIRYGFVPEIPAAAGPLQTSPSPTLRPLLSLPHTCFALRHTQLSSCLLLSPSLKFQSRYPPSIVSDYERLAAPVLRVVCAAFEDAPTWGVVTSILACSFWLCDRRIRGPLKRDCHYDQSDYYDQVQAQHGGERLLSLGYHQ